MNMYKIYFMVGNDFFTRKMYAASESEIRWIFSDCVIAGVFQINEVGAIIG